MATVKSIRTQLPKPRLFLATVAYSACHRVLAALALRTLALCTAMTSGSLKASQHCLKHLGTDHVWYDSHWFYCTAFCSFMNIMVNYRKQRHSRTVIL